MKATPSGDIILIENPLTGNSSVSEALGLSVGQTKWMLPKDARTEVGKAKWNAAKKIVLVREPVERLLSGISLALRTHEAQAEAPGVSPEFAAVVEQAASLPHSPALALFLDYLTSSGFAGVPTWFLPQSLWLSAKFDYVIATNNIAEFFNARCLTGRSFTRKTFLASCSAKPFTPRITPEVRQAVAAIYAEDTDKFNRLLVWSPTEDGVRLISGYCAACQASRGKDFIPLVLSDPEEHTAAPLTKKK